MLYRNYKQISTGKWINIVMTSEGEFSVAPQVEAIAEATGIDANDIQVIESNEDKRTGELIQPLETESPPAPLTEEERIAELEAIVTDLLAEKLGVE